MVVSMKNKHVSEEANKEVIVAKMVITVSYVTARNCGIERAILQLRQLNIQLKKGGVGGGGGGNR